MPNAKSTVKSKSKSKSSSEPTIKDRIKEFRRVPANTLIINPKNWRKHPEHQKRALKDLLTEIGFAGAELVRELPDGSLMLIDGHARAEIMGTDNVPVLVLDVTEQEADKLLATYDPIGAMAISDNQKLTDLLKSLDSEVDEVFVNIFANQVNAENKLVDIANTIPDNNTPIDEKELTKTTNSCPKCGFKW